MGSLRLRAFASLADQDNFLALQLLLELEETLLLIGGSVDGRLELLVHLGDLVHDLEVAGHDVVSLPTVVVRRGEPAHGAEREGSPSLHFHLGEQLLRCASVRRLLRSTLLRLQVLR